MTGRFSTNLATNLLNFGFSVLVGIWLTPYLIRHLGVSAYGLIPLVTTMTSYLALFTLALTSVSGRFMTIALERKDYDEANRVFNTSFWGTVGILLVLLAPSLGLVFHAGLLFNVPPGHEQDFTWLALAALGMFYLTTLSSAFGISAFCRNRFDLTNAVNVLNTVIRVVVVVLLFNLYAPRVWHVGAGIFLASAFSCAGAYLIWRGLTPMLELRLAWFSLATLHEMTRMGWWIVITSVGSILYLSIDLVVVNKMLGVEATGQYGAVMTWSALLRSFAGVIAGVFGPTIIMLYSRHDQGGLVQYSRRAVRFVGLVMVIPIGLICGLSKPLLTLWLGPSFAPLAPVMCLMTVHLCINLAVLPLFNIQVATNRVRIPGIVTCVMGMMNLALAITLCGPVGWGMYGVAAAGAIMLTAKNLIFTPVYAARVLGLRWKAFYRELIPILTLTLALVAMGWIAVNCVNIDSWSRLIVAGLFLGAGAATVVFGVVLDRTERAQVLRLVVPRITVSTP